MNSSLEIHVEFSFKGEDHALSATVNLDEILQTSVISLSFHAIIAKNNDVDLHSYLFEVMAQAELVYVKATGPASGFLKEGYFDLEGFSEKWHESRQ